MARTLTQRYTLSTGGARVLRINAAKFCGSNSFTGTPVITEVGTSDLTLSNKAVNTATFVDDVTGNTVAIGKGIYFKIDSGGVVGTTHRINIKCDHDGSPDESYDVDVLVDWV